MVCGKHFKSPGGMWCIVDDTEVGNDVLSLSKTALLRRLNGVWTVERASQHQGAEK